MTTPARRFSVALGLLFIVGALATWTPGVRAQQDPTTASVRIAPNDPLFGAVLAQLRQINTTLAAGTRLRGPLGSPDPIGDGLKLALAQMLDPCMLADGKADAPISQTATTRLVTGRPGLRIFGCAARLVAGVAEIPSFIEGTGNACGTGTTAVSGSTTAANGESYAANGGFQGAGAGAILLTNVRGNDLCLQQNGSNRLAGNLVYKYAQ